MPEATNVDAAALRRGVRVHSGKPFKLCLRRDNREADSVLLERTGLVRLPWFEGGPYAIPRFIREKLDPPLERLRSLLDPYRVFRENPRRGFLLDLQALGGSWAELLDRVIPKGLQNDVWTNPGTGERVKTTHWLRRVKRDPNVQPGPLGGGQAPFPGSVRNYVIEKLGADWTRLLQEAYTFRNATPDRDATAGTLGAILNDLGLPNLAVAHRYELVVVLEKGRNLFKHIPLHAQGGLYGIRYTNDLGMRWECVLFIAAAGLGLELSRKGLGGNDGLSVSEQDLRTIFGPAPKPLASTAANEYWPPKAFRGGCHFTVAEVKAPIAGARYQRVTFTEDGYAPLAFTAEKGLSVDWTNPRAEPKAVARQLLGDAYLYRVVPLEAMGPVPPGLIVVPPPPRGPVPRWQDTYVVKLGFRTESDALDPGDRAVLEALCARLQARHEGEGRGESVRVHAVGSASRCGTVERNRQLAGQRWKSAREGLFAILRRGTAQVDGEAVQLDFAWDTESFVEAPLVLFEDDPKMRALWQALALDDNEAEWRSVFLTVEHETRLRAPEGLTPGWREVARRAPGE